MPTSPATNRTSGRGSATPSRRRASPRDPAARSATAFGAGRASDAHSDMPAPPPRGGPSGRRCGIPVRGTGPVRARPCAESERASHCRRFRNRDGGARVPEPAAHGHPGPVGPAAARIAERSGCAIRVSEGIPHGGGRPGALGRNPLRILPAVAIGRPRPGVPRTVCRVPNRIGVRTGFSVVAGSVSDAATAPGNFAFGSP